MANDRKRRVTAAVLLIGDELLSGRTQEANLGQIALAFATRGVDIAEARTVGDDVAQIVRAINALRAEHDYVVTTGGIGPTLDDVTVEAVAAAFGVVLHEHPGILKVMETLWDAEPDAVQRRMARAPVGAQLIKSPGRTLPGLAFENVFVLAGVPVVVRGMLEDVVWRLEGGAVTHSRTVLAEGCLENAVAEPMEAVAAAFPDVSLGSYPFQDRYGASLVLRGRDVAELDAAVAALIDELRQRGIAASNPEVAALAGR